jgi:hypothetical protein
MGEPGRYTHLYTEKMLKWVVSKHLCKTRFNGRHGRRSTGRWKVGKFANGTVTAPVRRLPLSRCDGHGRQPYACALRVVFGDLKFSQASTGLQQPSSVCHDGY